VWLGIINNPNGTVGWGLSRNEWKTMALSTYQIARKMRLAEQFTALHERRDVMYAGAHLCSVKSNRQRGNLQSNDKVGGAQTSILPTLLFLIVLRLAFWILHPRFEKAPICIEFAFGMST